MKVAIIIWDGLRPESVHCGLTPALCALSDRGVTFAQHTAVFPTETRVNSSSIATGSYPERHGIVANRFWDRPAETMINTGDPVDLESLRDPNGKILPVLTMSEILHDAGYRCLVVGAGSPGSTLLQAPSAPDQLINVRGVIRPESDLQPFLERYGAFPEESLPPDAWNDLACRVFADGARSGEYDLGILWLCDPDFTQHKKGLGAPESLKAIRVNDGRLAKLFRDFPDDLDLIVASDHGFSTVDSEMRPASGWLDVVEGRLKFGSSGIYLEDPERDLERVVAILKKQEWVGPVFLKQCLDHQRGIIDKTFSQDLLRIGHPDRAPDIVYSKRWTHEKNEFGISGMVWGAGGVATHGSLSPYDRKCVLIGAGPSFRAGIRSQIPSSVVDIAPTVLHLFGEKAPMDGRILKEGLRGGADEEEIQVERTTLTGIASQTLKFARVGESIYLDGVDL